MAVGVPGPGGDDAGGSSAAGASPEQIVGVDGGAAVHGFAQDPAGGVADVLDDAAVATGYADQVSALVVRGGGGRPVVVAPFGQLARRVVAEGCGAVGGVDDFEELVGAVEPVGQVPAVEVGLADQVSGLVVPVPPHRTVRGDREELQLGVVGEVLLLAVR